MKLRDYLITTFAPLLGVFSTNAADASVLENMANEAVRTENHAPMPLFNETKYYDTETIFVPDFEGGNGDDDDKFKKKVQSESNQDTTKLDVVKEVLNINHHDYKSISLEKRNPDDMFERNVDALINNEGDSTLEFTVNQVRMAEQTPSDEIAFTPDGKYFAFTRKSSTKKNKDELFVINKENDSLIQLVNEYNYIKDLNLSSDGKSISFLASKNGRKYHTVYSFFEEGVRAEDYVLKKNISKMSITDVIVKDVPTSVIQRKNLFGSKVEMIQPLGFSKRRLSSVGINAYDPSINPEGTEIVFVGKKKGLFKKDKTSIYHLQVEDFRKNILTTYSSSSIDFSNPQVSPDGDGIIALGVEKNSQESINGFNKMYHISKDGVLTDLSVNESEPGKINYFSKSGDFIVYTKSFNNNNDFEIYIKNMKTLEDVVVKKSVWKSFDHHKGIDTLHLKKVGDSYVNEDNGVSDIKLYDNDGFVCSPSGSINLVTNDFGETYFDQNIGIKLFPKRNGKKYGRIKSGKFEKKPASINIYSNPIIKNGGDVIRFAEFDFVNDRYNVSETQNPLSKGK